MACLVWRTAFLLLLCSTLTFQMQINLEDLFGGGGGGFFNGGGEQEEHHDASQPGNNAANSSKLSLSLCPAVAPLFICPSLNIYVCIYLSLCIPTSTAHLEELILQILDTHARRARWYQIPLTALVQCTRCQSASWVIGLFAFPQAPR